MRPSVGGEGDRNSGIRAAVVPVHLPARPIRVRQHHAGGGAGQAGHGRRPVAGLCIGLDCERRANEAAVSG
jgi:hypothetical protein